MSLHDDLLDQELNDTLAAEFKKRGQVRCAGLVAPDSIAIRSARVNPIASGLGAGVRVIPPSSRRCRRAGVQQEGDRMFCQQHAPLWRTHYEILDRILEIPPRD